MMFSSYSSLKRGGGGSSEVKKRNGDSATWFNFITLCKSLSHFSHKGYHQSSSWSYDDHDTPEQAAQQKWFLRDFSRVGVLLTCKLAGHPGQWWLWTSGYDQLMIDGTVQFFKTIMSQIVLVGHRCKGSMRHFPNYLIQTALHSQASIPLSHEANHYLFFEIFHPIQSYELISDSHPLRTFMWWFSEMLPCLISIHGRMSALVIKETGKF